MAFASCKELLEAAKEPTVGCRYKACNDSLKTGVLTIGFEKLR